MISLIRAARLLRQESLDDVAAAVKCRKAWLSIVERFPSRNVGNELQDKLAGHFGVPWHVLSRSIDGASFAAALLAHVASGKKSKHA